MIKSHEETAKRKALYEDWNSELRTKLNAVKAENKQHHQVGVQMKMQIEELQETLARQTEQLDLQSNRVFDLETQAEHDAPQLERVTELEQRVRKLSRFLLAWCVVVAYTD